MRVAHSPRSTGSKTAKESSGTLLNEARLGLERLGGLTVATRSGPQDTQTDQHAQASSSPRRAGGSRTPGAHCGRSTRGQGFGHDRRWDAHAEALICQGHTRGRRPAAYRLGATRALPRRGHRGRARPRLHAGCALRRPTALRSNGLVRTCAVATPLLHGSTEAASDFVRNGL